jgi:hypothetical protein
MRVVLLVREGVYEVAVETALRWEWELARDVV